MGHLYVSIIEASVGVGTLIGQLLCRHLSRKVTYQTDTTVCLLYTVTHIFPPTV